MASEVGGSDERGERIGHAVEGFERSCEGEEGEYRRFLLGGNIRDSSVAFHFESLDALDDVVLALYVVAEVEEVCNVCEAEDLE